MLVNVPVWGVGAMAKKIRRTLVFEILAPYFPENAALAKELAGRINDLYKKAYNPSETQLHNTCKVWFIRYCEDNSKECNWSFQHSLSLNLLLDKLKKSYQKKFTVFATEDNIFDSFKLLIENLPEFYAKGMYLSTINSSYDSIINQIRSNAAPKIDKNSQHNRTQAAKILKGEL